MLNFVFLKSQWQNEPLLGKTVCQHMFESLKADAAHARILDRLEEEPTEDAAVLTLDMPLITLDDIQKTVERMRTKGIGELRLDGGDSPARIILGGGGGGYFSNDEAFLRIVDAKSYSMVYNHMRRRIIDAHLARGVNIPFADSVCVDSEATIEAGALVLPFSRIEGRTHICGGACVAASCVRDSEICAGASVESSHIANSYVGEGASVGPFARLRGARIGDGCRVGDFVEVKASELGDGVKAAHLTYIGDADVGARTNVGCGTVFCNYDGKTKRKTKVGEDCFIGANVNLVAPLQVGSGAFVAAGTTLTEDVAENSFAIGRAKQTTKLR